MIKFFYTSTHLLTKEGEKNIPGLGAGKKRCDTDLPYPDTVKNNFNQ